MPIDILPIDLGLAPQYHQVAEADVQGVERRRNGSTDEPQRLWKTAWNEFPECQAELKLLRVAERSCPPCSGATSIR